jgi:hypothetical protein
MQTCLRKRRYKTRILAERRAELDFKHYGVRLRVYPCSTCMGFHLSSETLDVFLDQLTNEGLRDAVDAYGKEISADDRRFLEQELRRIAQLVEADRRWLEQEADRQRVEAERLRELAENLKIARKMMEERTR